MLGLRRYKNIQIDIWQGDITSFYVDAMVNAANESLLGGLGVDGAIHRAGGPSILAECKVVGGCKTGSSVVTRAGNLPATWVIHAVGPIWQGGQALELENLRDCYLSIFENSAKIGAAHISIPAISTGAYGLPAAKASEIAFLTTKNYIDQSPSTSLRRITFVAFDATMYDVLQEHLFARFADELNEEGY